MPKTDQPRRSSRISVGPNRYKDEDAIRKKSTRSKPKTKSKPKRKPKAKSSPIAKREIKSKAKSTTAKRSCAKSEPTRTRLRFNDSNNSDDNDVRIVLDDKPYKYTPKPLEGTTNRQYQSVGQRVQVDPKNLKLNPFQLANMRATKNKQQHVVTNKIDDLAIKFYGLQPPGFK